MRPSFLFRLLSLVVTGAAAVALAACGGGSSTAADVPTAGSGAGAPEPPAGKPVQGGTIVYGTDREPTCLDPHNLGDMPQTYIARQFLDSLVSMQPDGTVVPWLADSWEVSEDGLQYTFKLKKGVKFTDGEPFDAEAVKANFVQTLDPETQSSTNLVYLTPIYKSTDVLDEHTVRINLKRPYSPFLEVLGQAFFGMESPKAMARGLEKNCLAPVGTGPFVVKKWTKGQSVELVRNPDYNSPPADANNQGPAYLDAITWRFLPDSSVRYSALTSGEADVIFNIPPEHLAAAKADSNLEVQEFIHAGIGHYIVLDNSEPPFDDLKVRQAFTLAANAPAAVESAYQGAYPTQTSAISSGTPFHTEKFDGTYPYDVERANKLLDEAGWQETNADGIRVKDGKPLAVKFIYSSEPGDVPPAELTLYQNIQAALKEAGIDLKLTPTPQAAYYEASNDTAQYDANPTYWNSPTAMVMYIVYASENYDSPFANMSKVKNPELDKTLLAAAAADPDDRATQARLYEKAQKIIVENAYALPMYPEQTVLGINTALKGVWIEPSEGEPVLSDAWLEG